MEPEHISWKDVIQVDSELVYQLSSEDEIQAITEQVEDFLNLVESTKQGQELLRAIQEQQKEHNNGEKINLKLASEEDCMAYRYGVATINIHTPEYTAFIDQNTGEPMATPLERAVFHELVHTSDERLTTVLTGDVLGEEYATQETDRFARDYMPSLGQRVAYLNWAGNTPTAEDRGGKDGMRELENSAQKRDEIVHAIKDLSQRIKEAKREQNQEKTPQEDNKHIPEPHRHQP